ncbi:MAG TPA: hypothetical protein VKA98_05025 [Nitrososphaeraceae archaeon]|nr:hypothetical protein [Nitrososphaeraceae archaeon]
METDDSRGNEAVAMIAILVARDNSFKILLNIARYNNIYQLRQEKDLYWNFTIGVNHSADSK